MVCCFTTSRPGSREEADAGITAENRHPHPREQSALKDGTVTPRGLVFDFEEVPVLVAAFRRMVRELEFDVSEMAFTTYLDRVTWVHSGDEHVVEYRPPANVVPMPPGGDLADMLGAGEIAAGIGVDGDLKDVGPLIPDAREAGLAALRRDGYYPINHLVVVKDELLEEHPHLAADVFAAFAEYKNRYVERLRAGLITDPSPVDRLHEQVMAVTGADSLPYGISPNRPTSRSCSTSPWRRRSSTGAPTSSPSSPRGHTT